VSELYISLSQHEAREVMVYAPPQLLIISLKPALIVCFGRGNVYSYVQYSKHMLVAEQSYSASEQSYSASDVTRHMKSAPSAAKYQ